MSSRIKNLLIGLFVSGAIAGIIVIILFLKPSVGDGEKKLLVRFSNIAGINVGTRVTLAGRPVGEVTSIKPIKDARFDQVDDLGRVYFYQLTLSLDSHVKVYNTDEISVQTTGLLGEKSVAIIPKAPGKNQKPVLVTNQVLYADSTEPLESALHNITKLAKKATFAIEDINEWFVENSDSLTQAVSSFAAAMGEIDIALKEVNQKNVVTSINNALMAFGDTMDSINDALEELEERGFVSKLDTLVGNFATTSESFVTDGRPILHNLHRITQDIADGTGTIGKLIKSDGLYLQVSSILSKVNTLMNDVNHYGILFQYDKHWQRTREKRQNLLNSLKTARGFKNYFEDEVDSINTSIARLSKLMQKAKEEPNREEIYSSLPFQKDFSELLRQVETLSDHIKLYNDELIHGK